MSEDDVEGLDEEFLHHLDRGADLLVRGELEPASVSLSRARALRPRDPKTLGLLGQSLYKLGRFDDAIEVYAALVEENPVEAAARVNLGLANLKAKRYAPAVRQLEIALDLNPEHKKAMGYMGLAWLEQGHFARAREWFQQAGSEAMVAKCDELLAVRGAGANGTAPRAVERPTPPPAPEPAPPSAPAAEDVAPQPAAPGAVPDLSTFAAARAVARPAGGRFDVAGELLTVAVDGDVLARQEGLLAARGALRLTPERKRFRGRTTDRPFGEGARRMLRASGKGALLYRPPGVRLTAVELAGESAYVVEDVVFAFEEPLSFENGRVASRPGHDVNLVHLSGRGQVLLATRGEIAALEATRDAPVRVPLSALVRWTGSLTPRIVPLAEAASAPQESAPGEPLVVELGGDGRVLLDAGAAP